MTKATNGKAPAKVNSTKAPAVADKADAEFTIAQLAKELKVDPRKARAALRASDLPHEPGSSWTFAKADRDKIVAIIKP
jgi:hypothetical protein